MWNEKEMLKKVHFGLYKKLISVMTFHVMRKTHKQKKQLTYHHSLNTFVGKLFTWHEWFLSHEVFDKKKEIRSMIMTNCAFPSIFFLFGIWNIKNELVLSSSFMITAKFIPCTFILDRLLICMALMRQQDLQHMTQCDVQEKHILDIPWKLKIPWFCTIH